MKFTKNLTEGNIYKAFLGFAFPLLLSYLLSQIYSTVDAVIAGKFISEYALGAVSATGSYENVFQSLFNGFAAGFGIYIAQQFGMEAYGVGADYRNYSGQTGRDIREVLARVKDVFSCIFKVEPTYLGEAIPVSGNGDMTNDKPFKPTESE